MGPAHERLLDTLHAGIVAMHVQSGSALATASELVANHRAEILREVTEKPWLIRPADVTP